MPGFLILLEPGIPGLIVIHFIIRFKIFYFLLEFYFNELFLDWLELGLNLQFLFVILKLIFAKIHLWKKNSDLKYPFFIYII
jgi:hypothetical protein